MSKTTIIYIKRFAENLRRELGQDNAQKVLMGSKTFTESTGLA